MIPTAQQIDVWLATVYADLDRLRSGMFDLIDIGPTSTVVARNPSRRDQAVTDRTPGPDGMFQPTPKTQSRHTGRSDPTGKAVVAWESEVQRAVTDLFAAVSGVISLVESLGIRPTRDGVPVKPPAEPPTEKLPSGVHRVALDPAGCRRTLDDALGWIGLGCDQLAERMRAVSDPDVADRLLELGGEVRRTVLSLARRVAPDRPRLCACGCRRPAPPVGEGATRSGCRSRLQRERGQVRGAA